MKGKCVGGGGNEGECRCSLVRYRRLKDEERKNKPGLKESKRKRSEHENMEAKGTMKEIFY